MKKVLDWSGYQDQGMGDAYADIPKHGEDYAKAISVCIRSGVCQKADNRGVMCPSFRVTGDINLSPGGRVQLFKQLLNQGNDAFLNDSALAESMENCVSCKGCKRECENNLDMSAIKAEYLAQKRRVGQRSLRSWLFAEFPYLLYRFPSLARLIRWRNKSSVLTKLGGYLFGINPDIILPEPANSPYADSEQQKKLNADLSNSAESPFTIVLLIDSFTALFHPHTVTDALEVLTACGYSVITLHPGSHQSKTLLDSGRSLFSQGYIARAGEQALSLLEALKKHHSVNRRIVGLEPSALLMLRDEYLMMNLGDEAASVAKNAFLFEEFIARESMSGRFKSDFKSATSLPEILVHGHCHQKAVGAMKSMRKVLKLVPGLSFRFIESSCCGMAGSFGLESEHAGSSVEMAEQGLLPGLDAAPDAVVVCNGFSCSHQIYALRERTPVHLASLLARQLIVRHAGV